jgi:hypothetical protein
MTEYLNRVATNISDEEKQGQELREGETDNPIEASDEGKTYVPPVDPPVVPADPQNAEVASGFAPSAFAEAYDSEHNLSAMPDEAMLHARLREAFRADARTNPYADQIAIQSQGGIIQLDGVVEDMQDSDSLLEVAMRVEGVQEVIDKVTVRTLA